jgi:hypothetical protein
MRTSHSTTAYAPVLLFALLLAACGGDNDQASTGSDDASAEGALPAPARGNGSVTGMPDAPGPGDVVITGEPPAPPPELLPDGAFGLPPLEDNPETGLLVEDSLPDTVAETDVPGAVGVVREYYAAISAGDFGRAYTLWSDGGRSSGQSPDQFAGAFAGMQGITAQIGEPNELASAAGARLMEVPVSISTTYRNGDVRRYRGSYVLRRAAGDGASAEQRSWRIASADLREVGP